MDEIGGENDLEAASLCDELWLQDSGNRTWKFDGGHPGKTGLVLFFARKTV